MNQRDDRAGLYISREKTGGHEGLTIFYVWECVFGTWEHRRLEGHVDLDHLIHQYPDAKVSEETKQVWKDMAHAS